MILLLSCVCVIFKGIMVTQFVDGWDFVQTLGEGAYGEYVLLFLYLLINKSGRNKTSMQLAH